MGGARDFSLLQSVWTNSAAQPASYPVNTGSDLQEVKMPWHEPGRSSQFRAEVKNEWSYTSHFPICLHGVSWQLSTALFFCLYLIHHHLKMSVLSLSLTKHHGTLMHWGVEAHLHAFLILTLEQVRCLSSSPSNIIPGKRPSASIEYGARWAPWARIVQSV